MNGKKRLVMADVQERYPGKKTCSKPKQTDYGAKTWLYFMKMTDTVKYLNLALII